MATFLQPPAARRESAGAALWVQLWAGIAAKGNVAGG